MALVLKDRVQETATANTTVSFTMLGAATGYQSFSSIGNTNTTFYAATDVSGNWEAGIGTYSTSGPTLTRTTILSSSNAGSAVTFSGTVTVFVTYPSSKSVNLDASGNVSSLGTVASGTWNGATIAIAYGGTNSTATPTNGGITYGTGTAQAYSTAGTSGQVLTSAGAAAPTWTTATNANTASAIVQRDASGNFTAGTITAALTGNASTATTATNATNTAITNDTTTATAQYITFVAASSGNTGQKTHSTGLTFVPSTGAFTASGNVTAYSDERVKKDWANVATDFVEQLAKVKHGTYTRIDSGERQAGSSAQDWEKLLPEVVTTNENGMLSLAYGNAALVAAVKLAERVVALEARLAALEAKG
jgi:hypothetical protein